MAVLPEPAPAPFVPFPEDVATATTVTGAGVPEADVLSPAGCVLPVKVEQNGSGDVVVAKGHAAVDSEIRQVLGTRAATETTRGELPWDPAFGSVVHRLRHMNDSPAANALARELVGTAVEKYVTAVSVLAVAITTEDLPKNGGRVMRIVVVYEVRASGEVDTVEVLV